MRPMLETPIGELRKNRFADLDADHQKTAAYLEQLASQTSTSIDAWTLLPFAELSPENKRGINQAFFSLKDASVKGIDRLSIEAEADLQKVVLDVEMQKAEQIKNLTRHHSEQLTNARLAQARSVRYVEEAWITKKEIYALEGRSATTIVDDIKKVLSDGVWEFHQFKHSQLQLVTKYSVIMSETNATAGIDRRVNLGKYIANYGTLTGILRVHRHEQNAIVSGYYHPYVNTEGSICWGNASALAVDLLSTGKLYDVFGLLASLLSTYSPTASPYIRLVDFSRVKTRIDSHEAYEEEEPCCERCEQTSDDCDCCGRCEQTSDNCDCCGQCEQTSNNCDCCRRCEQTSDDCDCCGRCEQTSDDCDCCGRCDSSNDCTCCSLCDSPDSDNCGCCRDCNSTGTFLLRQGHRESCEHYTPPNPETSDLPF